MLSDGRVDSKDATIAPENASKFTFGAKLLLGFLAFILLGFFLIYGDNPQSRLTISSQDYKFKLEAKIAPKDEQNLQKFLEKLKIPKNTSHGFEFELDSTSSAKLAFASPVVLDFSAAKDSISFSGASHLPIVDAQLADPSGFRLPKDTTLAVYAKDLLPLILKNVSAGLNLNAQNGQFLVIFAGDDFFLSFKVDQIDFTRLQELGQYKQETSGETNIHLVKIPNDKTLAFFQDTGRAYVASSLEGAREIIAINQADTPHLNFPKTKGDVSLAIFAKYSDASSANNLEIFSPDAKALAPYLKEIKEALLVFSAEKIYGYVDF